jgi:hypothetical protein
MKVEAKYVILEWSQLSKEISGAFRRRPPEKVIIYSL